MIKRALYKLKRRSIFYLAIALLIPARPAAGSAPNCNSRVLPTLQRIPLQVKPAAGRTTGGRKSEHFLGCTELVAPAPKDCFAGEISRIAPTQVRCYKSVFLQESGCHPDCTQRRGQAGNAEIGYGLCTIEKDPVVRRSQGRGPACNNISTAAAQVACCISIMRRSPRYFGPATPKC